MQSRIYMKIANDIDYKAIGAVIAQKDKFENLLKVAEQLSLLGYSIVIEYSETAQIYTLYFNICKGIQTAFVTQEDIDIVNAFWDASKDMGETINTKNKER